MTESANKKGFYVLLTRELYRKAVQDDINWSKAFELGVSIMLGENKEEKELREERTKIAARLKHIDKKLSEIETMDDNESRVVALLNNGTRVSSGGKPSITALEFLLQCSEVIKANKGLLKPRTNLWNGTTNMKLTENQFKRLCERADKGEFDHD